MFCFALIIFAQLSILSWFKSYSGTRDAFIAICIPFAIILLSHFIGNMLGVNWYDIFTRRDQIQQRLIATERALEGERALRIASEARIRLLEANLAQAKEIADDCVKSMVECKERTSSLKKHVNIIESYTPLVTHMNKKAKAIRDLEASRVILEARAERDPSQASRGRDIPIRQGQRRDEMPN